MVARPQPATICMNLLVKNVANLESVRGCWLPHRQITTNVYMQADIADWTRINDAGRVFLLSAFASREVKQSFPRVFRPDGATHDETGSAARCLCLADFDRSV